MHMKLIKRFDKLTERQTKILFILLRSSLGEETCLNVLAKSLQVIEASTDEAYEVVEILEGRKG